MHPAVAALAVHLAQIGIAGAAQVASTGRILAQREAFLGRAVHVAPAF